MAKKMRAVGIKPADGGFGEWDLSHETYRKVVSAKEAAWIYSNYVTGEAVRVEELPDEHNISGRIHDEPDAVYAIEIEPGEYIYFGVWN